MFVYFLVRMRKCTWVSLKRPCSYIESVGVFWILFSCGFPHRNFLLLLLTKKKKKYAERTQKKKETKLVSSFAWLCCCYYCGFMMHESRGNWTRRYGQPHGGRVHRGLLFFWGIFSGGYSSKGENPIFFFCRAKLKKLCRINIIVMALLTSPPRAIIRRHGCTTFVPPARTHQHQTRPHHHSQQVGRWSSSYTRRINQQLLRE